MTGNTCSVSASSMMRWTCFVLPSHNSSSNYLSHGSQHVVHLGQRQHPCEQKRRYGGQREPSDEEGLSQQTKDGESGRTHNTFNAEVVNGVGGGGVDLARRRVWID